MGIFMLYIFSFIFSLFGMQLTFVRQLPLGMLLTLAMVVAALCLVLDLDFI